MSSKKASKKKYKCSVEGCQSKTQDFLGELYCFPKNPRLHQAWTEACARSPENPGGPEWAPNTASRVCSNHFDGPSLINRLDPSGRRRLVDGAVPTINLPGQEPTQTPTPFNVLSKAEVNKFIKKEAEEKKLTAEEHLEIRGDFATGKQYLLSLTDGHERNPLVFGNEHDLSDGEKLAFIRQEIQRVHAKNVDLVRKNKALRKQIVKEKMANLSQEDRKEIARDFLKPFFTQAQIDCFFRPQWIRHRSWKDEDFKIAIQLRKMMSKKAFTHLRKKRLVPMPSITSIRQYSMERGLPTPKPPPSRIRLTQPPTTLEGSRSQSRSAAKRQKTSTVGDYRTVKIEPTGFGIAADMPDFSVGGGQAEYVIVESQEAGLEVSKGERQYVAITTSSAAASSAAAAAASKARTAAALESAIETATGGQQESAEELLRHQNVEFTVENVMHHTEDGHIIHLQVGGGGVEEGSGTASVGGHTIKVVPVAASSTARVVTTDQDNVHHEIVTFEEEDETNPGIGSNHRSTSDGSNKVDIYQINETTVVSHVN